MGGIRGLPAGAVSIQDWGPASGISSKTSGVLPRLRVVSGGEDGTMAIIGS